jgi:uncharacterized protein (TIGR02246 family)
VHYENDVRKCVRTFRPINNPIYLLTFVAALGSGLVAGIFFTFSSFVMKALARVPPPHGITAMQSINVVVLNRWFFAVFFGTAVCCLALAITSFVRWQKPGAGYLLVGSLLYLIGTILVTIACNVPLNDTLAALNPTSADAGRVWTNYLRSWTGWNHVRTMAALAAAASFSVALCYACSPIGIARSKASSSMKATMLPANPEDCPRVFEQHFNAGDLDAVMALYEPEARFVARSGEKLVGRDAIRKVLARMIEAKTQFQSRVLRASTVGDIAQLYTDFEGTTVDASGKTIAISNKAIEVLRRQHDGSWKLIMGDPNGHE